MTLQGSVPILRGDKMGLTHFPHGIMATPNIGGDSGVSLLGPAPEMFGGQTYYVNNVRGSDGNVGTDPDHPFAQINKAIIVSEANRAASWGSSTSPYRFKCQRNRIYVEGTGVYYDKIDGDTNGVDPNHCDIIGIGDNSEANGDGQVQVGSSTTNTVALHTRSNTGSGEPGMFGTRWINFKFLGGGASNYAVELGKTRGSGFYYCNFSVNASSLGGMLCDEMFAGSTISHCQFSYNSSGTPTRCLYISGAGVHTDNRIENNIFYGATTTHITFEGGLSWGTIFLGNVFIGVPTNTIVDTSTYGAFYAGNFFSPATTYEISSTVTTSYAGNMVSNGWVQVNT